MIKAIIFDCWDTLFGHQSKKPHPFAIFAERIGKSLQDYGYLKLFERHFMLEKHNNLEVPIKKLLEELSIESTEKLIDELKEILEDALNSQKAFPETLKVLIELKKKYKLGLISNTIYQSFEGLEQKFKINEIFDVILKSYDTKLLKPDSKIFEIMIEKLKVNKNEALMIGDSLKDDIQSAEKFGIKGILIDRKDKYPDYQNRIKSLEELRQFLIKRS